MPAERKKFASVDDYIAAAPPAVRPVLESVRETVRAAAPGAAEAISYGIPTFKMGRNLVHFAAFKHHVGFYPPVRGDEALDAALAPFRGEKGNLRFPLDRPVPLDLIRRVVERRVAEETAWAAAKRRPKAKRAPDAGA